MHLFFKKSSFFCNFARRALTHHVFQQPPDKCAAACWSACNVPQQTALKKLDKEIWLYCWARTTTNAVSYYAFWNLKHRLRRCSTYQHTVSKHKDEEHIWMTFDEEFDEEFVDWCRIRVGLCHKFLSLSNFQYCILLVCAMKFLDRLWSGDAGML